VKNGFAEECDKPYPTVRGFINVRRCITLSEQRINSALKKLGFLQVKYCIEFSGKVEQAVASQGRFIKYFECKLVTTYNVDKELISNLN